MARQELTDFRQQVEAADKAALEEKIARKMEKLREKQERKKDKKNKQANQPAAQPVLKLFLFKQATMYVLKDRPVSDRLWN